MKISSGSITNIPGIAVGHAQDETGLTGCTVVLCEQGFTGGVDQRGGAPGTRETDLLRPMHLVEKVHAVLLSGGSAYGLDAAAGVMRYLEEKGIGFDVRVARVPIVPAAVLFDLGVGDPQARPGAEMGFQACRNASSEPPSQGNAGAGMGATVGKVLGPEWRMKGGLGSAGKAAWGEIRVGAIIAVNCFGDVLDPDTGRILAGTRRPGPKTEFANSLEVMARIAGKPGPAPNPGENTVIGVVATNASLSKEQANKLAQMAQNGLGRTLRPANSMFDGDTIFALAGGEGPPVSPLELSLLGELAAESVSMAVIRGVMAADSLPGIPSFKDQK